LQSARIEKCINSIKILPNNKIIIQQTIEEMIPLQATTVRLFRPIYKQTELPKFLRF
jgi:hypothetical protein